MNITSKTFVSLVFVFILGGVGGYLFTKIPKTIQPDLSFGTSSAVDQNSLQQTKGKIYTNNNYGFSFVYPSDMTIQTSSAMGGFIARVMDLNDHWIYEVVSIGTNNTSSLDNLTRNIMGDRLLSGSLDNVLIIDAIIDGVNAKKYTIKNYGDYGNTGAVVITNKNERFLSIVGDSSSVENAKNFDIFLAGIKLIQK